MTWPLFDSGVYDTYGANTADSGGTGLSYTTADTKGSYTQITSSTTNAGVGIWVWCQGNRTTTNQPFLFDIAIGAAASEVVIIANLSPTMFDVNPSAFGIWYFPISIPAATRLSARMQGAVNGTGTMDVGVMIERGSGMGPNHPKRVTTYGAETANSGGTQVDPGGTANTKGAWSQITSSTTNPIRQLTVMFANQQLDSATDYHFLFDVGIGAASSEQVIIPNLHLITADLTDCGQPSKQGPFNMTIPAGTRLAVRGQCSGTNATDRLIDVIIYGVD